jgi:hypothetical protein
MKKSTLISFLILCFWGNAFSQIMPEKANSKITVKPTATSTEDDFLDSLAMYFDDALPSSITIRMGYSPQAYFAGRDYGIKQYSFSPSIMYSHSSGLYADVTGLGYSSSVPMYEVTLASLGYMGMKGDFLYFGEYSRSFYTDATATNSLPNSISLFGIYDYRNIIPMVGYSLLFGSDTPTTRIILGLSTRLKTKKIGFIDNITFSPGISATLGTSKSYSNTIQSRIQTIIKQGGPGRGGIVTPVVVETVTNNFGIMAYTLALPVALTIKKFRMSITGNFIKPVKTYSAEDITTKWVFGVNTSLSYSIDW